MTRHLCDIMIPSRRLLTLLSSFCSIDLITDVCYRISYCPLVSRFGSLDIQDLSKLIWLNWLDVCRRRIRPQCIRASITVCDEIQHQISAADCNFITARNPICLLVVLTNCAYHICSRTVCVLVVRSLGLKLRSWIDEEAWFACGHKSQRVRM